MPSTNSFVNAGAASERFFRLYQQHCIRPNRDTLFSLLEAGHSLNDRLKKNAALDFFDFREFVALKCLRNYFHHQQELRHVVRLVPLGNYPLVTDLVTMCLLPHDIVDAAIKSTSPRHRGKTWQACQAVFHWYGPIVNINPCLFNFVVLAFERLTTGGIPLTGDAVEQFKASYRFEEENGFSHFVDGKLTTSAGSVSELLTNIMATEGL